MTIQGLNITVSTQRNVKGADDAVGGATAVLTYIVRGARARISSLKPTVEMQAQGLETTNILNAHVVPSTLDIRPTDYLIPESGPYKDEVFLVTGSHVGSLHQNSPRSFLALRLQRVTEARSTQ